MTQMTTCHKCGGAIFHGSGSFGWGGKICYCREQRQVADSFNKTKRVGMQDNTEEKLDRILSELAWIRTALAKRGAGR